MRIRPFPVFQVLFVLLLVPAVVVAQSVRQLTLAQSTSFPATPPTNANAANGPELDSALIGGDADNSDGDTAGPGIAINRTIAKNPGNPMSHGGNGKAKSNPELRNLFHEYAGCSQGKKIVGKVIF